MKKAFEYGQRAKSILIRRPQRKIDSTEYGNRIAVCAFAGAVCRLSDFFNSLLEEELARQADRMVGGEDAILVVDDTALPKKGKLSK